MVALAVSPGDNDGGFGLRGSCRQSLGVCVGFQKLKRLCSCSLDQRCWMVSKAFEPRYFDSGGGLTSVGSTGDWQRLGSGGRSGGGSSKSNGGSRRCISHGGGSTRLHRKRL